MNQAQPALVYSEELYKKHYGTIINAVTKTMGQFALIETGMDFEDYVQEANIVFLGAIKSYKPERGASFNTYLQMQLFSRLGSMRNKYLERRRRATPIRMDDLSHGDSNEGFESYEDTINRLSCIVGEENFSNVSMDIEKALEKYPYYVQMIYREHYINSRTLKEIVSKFGKDQYNVIKQTIENLKEFHNDYYAEEC